MNANLANICARVAYNHRVKTALEKVNEQIENVAFAGKFSQTLTFSWEDNDLVAPIMRNLKNRGFVVEPLASRGPFISLDVILSVKWDNVSLISNKEGGANG